MYAADGSDNTVLLKGRHRCECQAVKHKLVNNCLRCARIVCEQEGSGPCLFCGNLVCSEEEARLIESSTKKGDNLKKSLSEQHRPKGWEEAMSQRNRLLEYDKSSAKRTEIIDDESDYFKTNSVWLSETEKKKLAMLEEQMREKKHAGRMQRKVTIDFAGRQIVDEPQLTKEFEDDILREIAKSAGEPKSFDKYLYERAGNDFELPDSIHPGHEGPIPVYIEISDGGKGACRDCEKPMFDGVYNRVQDKEYLEISDLRNCMSMHQPWASLLVAGIKKHEGRTWYSSHRGRLWIAATAKPVDPDEVKRLEKFYRAHYNDNSITFPTQYPSSCLLGCVSVQECLPQEEYQKHYPGGESDSPFVFVCSDFHELPIRFPIRGEPKICEFFYGIFHVSFH